MIIKTIFDNIIDKNFNNLLAYGFCDNEVAKYRDALSVSLFQFQKFGSLPVFNADLNS